MASWCYLVAVPALLSCGSGSTEDIRFEEVTDERMPEIRSFVRVSEGLGAAIGDVNGDGRPDVYFAGGGLHLNRVDPAGFRLEYAGDQGIPDLRLSPTGVAFGDYDRDGDLDLALCGWGCAFADLDGDGFEELMVGQGPNRPIPFAGGPVLLRNGGGRFREPEHAFGLLGARAMVGDGDQDLITAPRRLHGRRNDRA